MRNFSYSIVITNTTMSKSFFVYMLTNARNRVIYTGITSDIEKRILQHKYKQMEGFTKKYNVDKLVHIEEFTNPYDALEREKEIKNWSRQKKIDLIEKNNPNWEELFIE